MLGWQGREEWLSSADVMLCTLVTGFLVPTLPFSLSEIVDVEEFRRVVISHSSDLHRASDQFVLMPVRYCPYSLTKHDESQSLSFMISDGILSLPYRTPTTLALP